MPTRDDHIEMREPLRGLCRGYIDECFRKIEAEHGYPGNAGHERTERTERPARPPRWRLRRREPHIGWAQGNDPVRWTARCTQKEEQS